MVTPTLSRRQAAALAGVTPQTIDAWRRNGLLPSAKIGRTVRIRAADLDALLNPPEEEPVAA